MGRNRVHLRRMDCAKRAVEVMWRDPVAIDTETACLGIETGILELGAVSAKGVVLFGSLICLVGSIPAVATGFCGIASDLPHWHPDLVAVDANLIVIAIPDSLVARDGL